MGWLQITVATMIIKDAAYYKAYREKKSLEKLGKDLESHVKDVQAFVADIPPASGAIRCQGGTIWNQCESYDTKTSMKHGFSAWLCEECGKP